MKNYTSLFVLVLIGFSNLCQAQWTPVSGPNNGNVLSLINNTTNHIYAGTKWEGMYQSSNHGNSWDRMTTYGMGDSSINALGHDESGNLYAGTNDGLYQLNEPQGMWHKIFLDGKIVQSITRGLSNTFWISTNVGACVVGFSSQAPNFEWRTEVDTLFKLASHDNSISLNYEMPYSATTINSITSGFASTGNGNRILKWHDLKHKWVVATIQEGIMLKPVTGQIVTRNSGSGLVVTNEYISQDFGNTWTKMPVTYPHMVTYSMLIDNNKIYAAGNNGMYVSSNLGNTWTAINNQLPTFDINALIVDGANGNEVMAATSGDGIFSIEAPFLLNWKSIGFSKSKIKCVAAFERDLFAGAFPGKPNLSVANNFAYGIDWNTCKTGLPPTGVSVFSLGFLDTGNVVLAGTSLGIFSSGNRGQTWSLAGNSGNITAISIASKGTTVCAASYGSVYLSMNNGASWSDVTNNLPGLSINGVAFDSFSNVYLATSAGVYMSDNDGQTWSLRGLGGSSVYSIVTVAEKVFAGTYGNVMVSSNFGTSWSAYGNGLSGIDPVKGIAVKGNQLILATGSKVFFNSISNGTWTEFSSGLPNLTVNSISVSDSLIFAGTNGSGVWKHRAQNLTASPKMLSNSDEIDLFPNPAAGKLFIQSNSGGIESITITNMLGRNVRSEFFSDSPRLIPVSLPVGFYVVQVVHQGKTSIRKIVIE